MAWNELHGGFFAGRRVLVTGGAGFIGSHLAEALVSLGASVTVLDDLSGGSLANLQSCGPVNFVEGSILDQAVLDRCTKGADFVFHQAALGSVPRSLTLPRLYQEVNATGTLNVLEAARNGGVKRVIFAASSSAYGNTQQLPKVETMPPQPRSPYAATKVACESMLKAYSAGYGLDTVSLRYFNIFGPRQNANSAYAAVIAAFLKAVLSGRPPVIFGDGEHSRDFTFVDNAVHANLLAARCEQPLNGEVFNIACGQRVSLNCLADAVLGCLGRPDLKPVHQAERPGDVRHSLADLNLASRRLNYRPIVDFAAGLNRTVAWYRLVFGQQEIRQAVPRHTERVGA